MQAAEGERREGMIGRAWTFDVMVPQESADGIRGLTDKVQIIVKSGDPGGELGEFAYFMEGCLREWFDTVEVTCNNLSGEEATHEA
jgi:hypothetical protein